MNGTRVLGAAALALLASACNDAWDGFKVGGAQQAASQVRPPADTFRRGLYSGYMQLAQDEYYEGNYSSALVFYRKASAVARGDAVPPEDVQPWLRPTGLRAYGLHGADLNTVQDFRPRLVAWMADGSRLAPDIAAKNQTNFDCWIEELSEQQYQEALPCFQNIQLIVFARPQAAPAPPPLKTFLVFFDFDRSDITVEADRVIREAVNAFKARPNQVMIGVVGHTDRSGTVTYNQQLSDRRATAVVGRLIQYGVERKLIRAEGRGESQPLVPTADGVREPQNRRVEIGETP